ncbi:hypothetical protein THTE_0279 [Thermogutta terrifontis]|uniref:Uncharacterized protein n=1 Tax=Thermogutta terrifontis TaxID=1331910 RepID=A0A286RAA3_9BACT|nr:hypothetical protein THTE_0279 [Thermogutta terrifontis]
MHQGDVYFDQQKRAAGFVRGNKLSIALRYSSHAEYEQDSPSRTVAEFDERLREFFPWTPPTKKSTPNMKMPDEWEELTAINADLPKRVAALEEIIRQYEQQEAETLLQMQYLQDQVAELTRHIEQWHVKAEDLIREQKYWKRIIAASSRKWKSWGRHSRKPNGAGGESS